MKVTVDAKDLAKFVYQCVAGFYIGDAKNYAEMALKEENYLKRTVLTWASACVLSVAEMVEQNKKLFLRITRKNIKENFGKGKSND